MSDTPGTYFDNYKFVEHKPAGKNRKRYAIVFARACVIKVFYWDDIHACIATVRRNVGHDAYNDCEIVVVADMITGKFHLVWTPEKGYIL